MVNRRRILALSTALAVPLAGWFERVDAKKKRKTVTRTYSNSSTIMLPGSGKATPYPSSISVSGLRKGKIKKVRVHLTGFTEPVPDNIDLLLVATHLPGVNALIMSDAGGAVAVANVNLVLDDDAANALPDNAMLTSGAYKPMNYSAGMDFFEAPAPTPSGNSALSVFNGQNPNGEWQLWVYDAAGNGPGQFSGGWALEITAQVKKK